MREGVAALASMVSDWSSTGNIPEVEWSKIRSLNFQEVLRSRSAYVQRIRNRSCLLCEKFEEHVGIFFVLYMPRAIVLIDSSIPKFMQRKYYEQTSRISNLLFRTKI